MKLVQGTNSIGTGTGPWGSDEGRILKEALTRHPIQPEECWPAVLGKDVYIRRGDMTMRPIIARDNLFVTATTTLKDMTEEKRLQTLATSADLQARVGQQRGALIAVRVSPIGEGFGRGVVKYEVITYTLTGVESGVYS